MEPPASMPAPKQPSSFSRQQLLIVAGIILFIAGVFLVYLGLKQKFGGPELEKGRPAAVQPRPLVAEKISQSADIAINLPPDFTLLPLQAPTSISFNPAIKGDWAAGQTAQQLIFKPQAKLALGKYYTLSIALDDRLLKGGFQVVEDPTVSAIFPKSDSESPEDSEITIIFTRPLVPLTTLDILRTEDIPVEITPPTPGKFKWISTRTLQFIPSERLRRSTNYTVKVKSGLVSLEGLVVPAFTHTFTTRHLRYEHNLFQRGQTVVVQFNQPVDLERSKEYITLEKFEPGQISPAGSVAQEIPLKIPFTVEYGFRTTTDPKSGEEIKTLDQSQLLIYSAKDSLKREKRWDYNQSYQVTMAGAYPQEGDIVLKEKQELKFYNILVSLTVRSARTSYSGLDFFDPAGELVLTFPEEIDKDSSLISAPNLKSVAYGEVCAVEAEGAAAADDSCAETKPVMEELRLFFEAAKFPPSAEIPITLNKIVNKSGSVLLLEELTQTVVVVPKLKILDFAVPASRRNVSVSKLTLCTNTPLRVPSKEEVLNYLQADYSLGEINWSESFRVEDWQIKQSANYCRLNQFQTDISWELQPNTGYALTFNLEDVFGQKETQALSFMSGQIPDQYRFFYQLHPRYNVTSPQNTSLTYAVENLEYVDLSICAIAPLQMLKSLRDYLDYTESPAGLPCLNRLEKKVELPTVYWTRNYFEVNLTDYISDPLGHYVITFSHPRYRDYRGRQVYEHTLLSVTNLAVQEKQIKWSGPRIDGPRDLIEEEVNKGEQNLYWVVKMADLEPVAEARITLYNDQYQAVGSITTEAQGVARSKIRPDLSGAIISWGADQTLLSVSDDSLQWNSWATSAEYTYLYTDRPIYRPGDQVFIKGLYRLGYDGNYEIFKDKKVKLAVFDSQREPIYEDTLEVNDYGTFTADLVLDIGVSLGTYWIEAAGGSTYFEVEEYVPSPFKVEVTSAQEEYLAGETLDLTVQADYFFGVPVENGEVEYTLMAQDYYFDRYRDEYFDFGNRWYYYYDAAYGDTFMLRDKTELDKSGQARFLTKLDFAQFFTGESLERSKIIIANITVKNANGQAVSRQKSVIAHRGEFYLGVNLDKSFVAREEPVAAKVKTVSTQGEELSVGKIKYAINKVDWEYFKRREVDGGYYAKPEKKLTLVQAGTVSTNGEGNASWQFSLVQEGEFELRLSANDSRGNEIVTSKTLYVYGIGAVEVRPTNNYDLEIAVDKPELEVGEEAKLIIKSPYQEGKALVAVERGRIFNYEIIDVDRNLLDYSFTIKEEYIPNVYASVLLLSPKPEVKYGQVNFKVNTKERTLFTTVTSDRDYYLPGEEVTLQVTTRDWTDQPVAGEVSIAVVDLSVLALKGNPKKNPLIFFYGDLPLTVTTSSNIKNALYKIEVPGGGAKGGGGGAPADLARQKRGLFKDTAFWEGIVNTGQAGQASVTFTLPDNLTTWQVETVGITPDTKLGVAYDEFTTKKKVMVIPLKPRFIIPGDEFSLGAQIFNQTADTQNFEVSFQSETLEILGAEQARQSVKLKPAETKTVYFPLRAPAHHQQGRHIFTLSAKTKEYEDTVEQGIAITRNDTYEASATAYYTNDLQTQEYLWLPAGIETDRGGLTVKTSATLAVFLSDALNYLVAYPYGCTEQIASKLRSLAIIKKGLSLENVGDKFTLAPIIFEGRKFSVDEVISIGLARIYENQTPAGGVAYYKNLGPNFQLTLHVVQTLADLKRAGYKINDDALARAADYLKAEITTNKDYNRDKDLVILTAYTFARLENFSRDETVFPNLILAMVRDQKFIREDISTSALAHLAVVVSAGGYAKNYQDEVFGSLENRLEIDGRGAFLSLNEKRQLYDYWETPIKNTALFLEALVAGQRESPLYDDIIRWLLNSRSKDGAWGSTQNTLSVLAAFTEYLEWKKETESAFALQLTLDDDLLAEYSFGPATILKTYEKVVPIKDFTLDKMSLLRFNKTNQNAAVNTYYYDLSLKYYLPLEAIPPRDEGLMITREIFALADQAGEQPKEEAKIGEVLRGHLTITVPKERRFVAIEDFIPAGTELINFHLSTADQSLPGTRESANSDNYWQEKAKDARQFYPEAQELHDDRLFLFKETLSPGVYEYDYFLRALIPGTFHHLPAVASEMYFPENFGRTAGGYFKVTEE